MRNIAVFQYAWPLQIHTINLLNKLAETGYGVDLFIYNCDQYALVSFNKVKGLTIYDLGRVGIFSKVIRRLKRLYQKKNSSKAKEVIAKDVLNRSLQVIKKNKKKYQVWFGIEKQGLIWAGKLLEQQPSKIPLIYYSLELYVADHPEVINKLIPEEVLTLEKRYHKTAQATIIQDKQRAAILFKNNKAQNDVIYLPVALTGAKKIAKSYYFHEKYGLSKQKKLILCYGLIAGYRNSLEIAAAFQQFKDRSNYTLIFHGYGEKAIIQQLRNYPDVIVSTELVNQLEISRLISAADLGLVIYRQDCANDRLTVFSSEKLAWYLKCGLPIIALDNSNYQVLFNKYRCGELIKELNSLESAVLKIEKGLDQYRQQAYFAYAEFYDYDKVFSNLKNYLEKL